MITYLYVNNYKSLVNIRLDFSAISVLIGQNGSGKTAVFDVLYSLKSFIMGGRSTDIFKAASLTRWMKSSIQTFEIGMNNKNKEYVYHLELEYNTVGQCLVVSEVVKYEGSGIFSAQNGSVSIMSYYLQNLKEYERVIDSLSIAKEEYLKLCNNQA